MDMDTIKDFLNNLFTEMGSEESILIMIFLVGSFLIGLLFGWWAGRRGKKRLRKALKQKESALITLEAEHKAVQEQLGLKEADLTKAELEVEELKTKVSQIEHEKEVMRSDYHESKTYMENLKEENLSYLSQIETLNGQVLSLESRATEREELIETAASNAIADVDLSQVQNNYDNANLRLAAIEEKLARMETENITLKSEISSMKDSSTIAFLDEDPEGEDEELVIEDVNEAAEIGEILDPEERSNVARQKLKAAFGDRISIASAGEKDDLKKINGIGPFIEQKLNDIGIYTYKQIGQFDGDLVEQITDAIQFFPGRIDRDDWVGQAKKLS